MMETAETVHWTNWLKRRESMKGLRLERNYGFWIIPFWIPISPMVEIEPGDVLGKEKATLLKGISRERRFRLKDLERLRFTLAGEESTGEYIGVFLIEGFIRGAEFITSRKPPTQRERNNMLENLKNRYRKEAGQCWIFRVVKM